MEPKTPIGLLLPAFAERQLHNWSKWKNLRPHLDLYYWPKNQKGVRWETNPNAYNDGSLMHWEKILNELPPLPHASIVLSDNLTAVLKHRPDAILSGNFLWGDILQTAWPQHLQIKKFAEQERRLLQKYRPLMLGTNAIAMPAVKRLTQWQGFGFYTQQKTIKRSKKINQPARIALLGGATNNAQTLLVKAAQSLAQCHTYQLMLPAPILRQAIQKGLQNVHPFGFKPEDFASCDLVICRPGVGTLTDCVQTATPILAVYEPNNPEMQHLAKRISDLGLGENAAQSNVLPWVKYMLNPKKWLSYIQNLSSQPTKGLEQAAETLLNRLQS